MPLESPHRASVPSHVSASRQYRSDPSAARILLVEDDRNIGTVLSILLEEEGFDVVWLKTVRSARAFLALEEIEVAVIDRRLPDGDGRTLIPLLCQGRPGGAIIISGSDCEAERQASLASGATAFVAKPFAVNELLSTVRRCVVEPRAEQAAAAMFTGVTHRLVSRSDATPSAATAYGAAELGRRTFDAG